MFLKFYPPHPLLHTFVNSIMLFAEDISPEEKATPIPYPPLPEQSLFFYPRSPILANMHGTNKNIVNPHSIIVGPQLKRVNITLGPNHIVIRVGFKPGGLHRLIAVPLYEMVDEACNTADFFYHQVQAVNEQLFNTSDYDAMVAIVEKFLLQKMNTLKPRLPFDLAMQELVKRRGALTVESLASLACVSNRQLERQCKERIGLSPKLFARLVRFSEAFRLFESDQTVNWTQIAHSCGYYDQMHFIKDCKEFAAVTPSVIAKEVSNAPVRLQYMLQW